MDYFRKLSDKFVFKAILLAIVALFILAGFGTVLLETLSPYVAKLDDRKITLGEFSRILSNARKNFPANSKESADFIQSVEFKKAILDKEVINYIITKEAREFRVDFRDDFIYKLVVKNAIFHDQKGKFDKNIFHHLLNRSGLSEAEYINNIKFDLTKSIILTSFSPYFLSNDEYGDFFSSQIGTYLSERRVVDIGVLNDENISEKFIPTNAEISEFFNKNRKKFILPETRNVEYIEVDPEDLVKNIVVTEAEIHDFYNSNPDLYSIPEVRDLYSLSFNSEKDASDALKELGDCHDFLNIAQKKYGKTEDDMVMKKIDKNSFPFLSKSDVFDVKEGRCSSITRYNENFHIFYVHKIYSKSHIPFSQVRDSLKANLLQEKKEKHLEDSLNAIRDYAAMSNSLDETAKKFNLSYPKPTYSFTVDGLDEGGNRLEEVRIIDNFVSESFAIEEGKVGRLFYSEKNKKYYSIFVKSVQKSIERNIDDVRGLVVNMWASEKKAKQIDLIAEEINKNITKENFDEIVKKYGIKINKNVMIINDSKKSGYSKDFLKYIYRLKKIDEVGKLQKISNGNWQFVVLKSVSKGDTEGKSYVAEKIRNSLAKSLANEYVKYLYSKYNVKYDLSRLSNL